MDTIIRNGTIVTAVDVYKADVGIKGGKIVAIADHIPAEDGVLEIEAQGQYVMPGGIDVHVHLELPFCGTVSKDDFANGTKAAACGGLTMLIDFAIQSKGHPIMEAVEGRRNAADGKVAIDYSLHGGITDWETATGEVTGPQVRPRVQFFAGTVTRWSVLRWAAKNSSAATATLSAISWHSPFRRTGVVHRRALNRSKATRRSV